MDKEHDVKTEMMPEAEGKDEAQSSAFPYPPPLGKCRECSEECIDIFVNVVKAKNVQKDEVIVGYVDEFGVVHGREICLDPSVCCCAEGISGPVTCVEDVRVRNLKTREDFVCSGQVRVHLKFDLIIIYRALCTFATPASVSCNGKPEEVFCVETLRDVTFTKEITLDEFCPPLTAEEFRNEVDRSEIIVRNFRFEVEVNGRCSGVTINVTDPNRDQCIPNPEGPGTCISLTVFADITDKLGKMEDILVCGRRGID
ncbi:MAG: hypothetical protein ACOX8W_02610 [bacterium]